MSIDILNLPNSFFWRVNASNLAGKSVWSDYFSVNKTTVSNENIGELPTAYSLKQNYPNPFNPTTKIEYKLPQPSQVKLEVLDILGKNVTTLVNEQKSGGTYIIEFNAEYLPSGIYLYRLTAGDFTQTKKLLLLK
ncbi:T9SS type A sorting domain-containing protein [bacterium]|nr:T9SS type A sorting domain-containing protein [bacterium]MBI9073755.1 T9SS type A sorting domain-containing protein [Melioribacteraceae bacterium]